MELYSYHRAQILQKWPAGFSWGITKKRNTAKECVTEPHPEISSVQLCSVSQLCPILWDPMDCSTPGLPVHHQLPDSAQTHVHQVSDAIQPSHPLLSHSPLAFSLSQHQSFPMTWHLTSSDKSIGASASASVLLMTIQGWFHSELTGLIFLLSKRLSRVFYSTTIWKHQFFGA